MNSVKGRQTESDAELHTRRHMLAARQKNSHTDEQYRLTDEQADRQLDRQTDRHKFREPNMHTVWICMQT